MAWMRQALDNIVEYLVKTFINEKLLLSRFFAQLWFFFAKKTQKNSHQNAPEVVGDAFWWQKQPVNHSLYIWAVSS